MSSVIGSVPSTSISDVARYRLQRATQETPAPSLVERMRVADAAQACRREGVSVTPQEVAARSGGIPRADVAARVLDSLEAQGLIARAFVDWSPPGSVSLTSTDVER
jgi:hypothetical protein